MYTLLHCHFCIQIITNHFLLSKVSHPIHTIPGMNKCTLIIPYLMPLEVFYQTQIIILPCMYFGCFHGNQRCVASYHYFYTWGFYRKWISLVRWDHVDWIWLPGGAVCRSSLSLPNCYGRTAFIFWLIQWNHVTGL